MSRSVTEILVTTVTKAREERMHEISQKESDFFHRLERQGLKPHQLEGVLWMSAMYDCGCSCILGDEMGMGKSLQAISLISRIIAEDPILIVAPLAVLKGWEEEFRHWAGDLPLFTYHTSNGKRREELALSLLDSWKSGLIVLTTPGMLVSDFEAINSHGGRWGLVVVDEAHNAKNSASIFSRHLQTLDTDSVLLLTGTIVHNNIEEELVHMLDFVLPSVAKNVPQQLLLSNKAKEGGLFVGTRPTEALEHIAQILYCFMLRRLIQDTPGVTMPPKISCTVYLHQTELQKKLYENAGISKELCDKHPFLALGTSSVSELKGADLGLLKAITENSNKLRFLVHILPILLAEHKHKVLIFSNSLSVLHLLGMILSELEGYNIDLITGDVNDIEERKQRLDRFNGGGVGGPDIMLLSTKAMGQGVQLTGADTVIFYDHHDNPQNDNQAEGRAYRITQHNPVLVLRLVTQNSKEAIAMESWVRQKREIQQWLEFTRVLTGKQDSLQSETERGGLILNNEEMLHRLLLERNQDMAGQWVGEWA